MTRDHDQNAALPPGLYVTATPIGNLGDVTLRAVRVLKAADHILCEDTRVAAVLMRHLGVSTPLTAYHDHNESRMLATVLGWLEGGAAVALISDAGTPLISDPGYRLVRAVQDAGFKTFSIPGASAVIAGLSISGLATDRFFFEGFLPSKAKARRDRLAQLKSIPATLVFYESPRRLTDTLEAMAEVLGDREAGIAREITKAFEEVRRGPLSALAAHYRAAGDPKGEIVLMVAAPQDEVPDTALVDDRLRAALKAMRLKDAVDHVTAETGASRREVYQRALALKDEV
jgi:16S rRNA (cytidine1402-2'-O)-methyltransferase